MSGVLRTATNTALLPGVFAEFESLVGQWSLATEALRFNKRVSSSMTELQAFDAQVFGHLDRMIDYLNTLATNDPQTLAAADRRLFDLVLMAMEARSAIDLEWETTDIEDAWPADRLRFLPPSDVQGGGR